MNKKRISLVLALVLLLTAVVGGTLAWLTDKTDEVKNTFTTSDVDIDLTETTTDYQMIPGYTIAKDPLVTVKAVSEKCYVFVKVEKSANFDSFMTYAIDEGWTAGDGTNIPANVYYRVVENTEADQKFAVLKDNKVTVKTSVTKEMMNGLTAANYPTMTFTAYATQYMSSNNTEFTAAQAWANVANPAGT